MSSEEPIHDLRKFALSLAQNGAVSLGDYNAAGVLVTAEAYLGFLLGSTALAGGVEADWPEPTPEQKQTNETRRLSSLTAEFRHELAIAHAEGLLVEAMEGAGIAHLYRALPGRSAVPPGTLLPTRRPSASDQDRPQPAAPP